MTDSPDPKRRAKRAFRRAKSANARSTHVDRTQTVLSWLKARWITAIAMLLATLVTSLVGLTESAGKIRAIYLELSGRPALSISTGFYVDEVAVHKTSTEQYLFHRLRDLSTNCQLFKYTLPWKIGTPALSPGIEGARAEFQMRLRIENTSGMRLTNVELLISGAPVEVDKLLAKPNTPAVLSHPSPTQGTEATNLVSIREIADGDFSVLTLSGPITRKNYDRVINRKILLTVTLIRADQFSARRAVASRPETAKEIWIEQGNRQAGSLYEYTVGATFRVLQLDEQNSDADLEFLAPPRYCPEEDVFRADRSR